MCTGAGSRVNLGSREKRGCSEFQVIFKNAENAGFLLYDQERRREKHKQGKVVVKFSGWFGNKVTDVTKGKRTTEYLKLPIDSDVVLVFTAGISASNNPDVNPCSQTAANTLPIIDVGNCNDDGKTDSDSQSGPLLSVLAPGDNVRSATNKRMPMILGQDLIPYVCYEI